jgi:DNA-binding beta-propeller fold protein YncE
MNKRRILQSVLGAVALLAWSLLGTVPVSQASTVKFIATDEPGPWFKCVSGFDAAAFGCVPASVAKTQSLAIIKPGDTVEIDNGSGIANEGTDTTNTVHTFTSLLYPEGARNMPFDQPEGAFRGSKRVTLQTEGLYVFVCKLHPFMLAATIVDRNSLADEALELGEKITLISYGGLTVPTSSDLATRLLRAFFLITNTANYQNYNIATNPTRIWHIDYPAVPVKITGGAVVPNLGVELTRRYGNDSTLPALFNPSKPGVGEVWIDTEYEKTSHKTKSGTATAVNASTWKVTKKVSLPGINMNNPHNMWTNREQTRIYQTQWFGNDLTVFNRITGRLIRNIYVGSAPAHVMTRTDTDQVHVSLNGDNAVIELNPGNMEFSRRIFTQFTGENPAQPHAHTMSFDGKTMVTPNSNTGDSTRVDVGSRRAPIRAKEATGLLPIATGMMPDASKYYVSNYLDSTITCLSIGRPACNDGHNKVAKKNIHLLVEEFLTGVPKPLSNYDPINVTAKGMSQSGALPIQTPVSPDGKFVVTANTLSGTITIISTETDTLVAVLPCSAGCHGVNFGAKKDGGYYAYVSSKFSNDMIVVDLDTRAIAGRVVLVTGTGTRSDDSVSDFAGMGGQGVLPIPLVYNGWVQQLPRFWKFQLTKEQRHPFGQNNDEHEYDYEAEHE